MSHLTSNLIIKELLKKLPEYLRLQWGQFVVQKHLHSPNIHQFAKWVSEQNEPNVSQVEIGVDNSKMKNIVEQITLVMFPDPFQTRTTNNVVFAAVENTRSKIVKNSSEVMSRRKGDGAWRS
jgi:hypothetical protein